MIVSVGAKIKVSLRRESSVAARRSTPAASATVAAGSVHLDA
jgi:hypothetical protein